VPLEVKSFLDKYLTFLCIMVFLLVQGCAMAAPAAITYGVNKLSTPAESAKTAPQPTELRTYPEYVTAMERINTEREKAGLQRRPIMTQEEWVCAQKAGSPQAAPAPPAQAPTPATAPAPPAAAAAAQTSAPAPAEAPAATVAPAPPAASPPAMSPAPAGTPSPDVPAAEPSEKAPEAK
jgi:hypothetical protein